MPVSRVWLRYILPNYLIQQRSGVICRYEVQMPELGEHQLGLVEKYVTKEGSVLWRSLDYRKNDWKGGFQSRERAAQNLVSECPAVIRRVSTIRDRLKELSP